MEAAGTAPSRSLLDKPLGQLTEDDISQLTREDCRKYLKQKGMRRPSWNKSQAIQQVLSLKALLETSEDFDASSMPRKSFICRTSGNESLDNSAKEKSVEERWKSFSSSRQIVGLQQIDSPKCSHPRLLNYPQEGDNDVIAIHTGDTNGAVGQMTIFYCGKVYVYDGVPLDKALEIIHFAATPFQPSLDSPISGAEALQFSCNLLTPNSKDALFPLSDALAQKLQTDGQTTRQVWLQRYLEK